jgi:hypothetical protein
VVKVAVIDLRRTWPAFPAHCLARAPRRCSRRWARSSCCGPDRHHRSRSRTGPPSNSRAPNSRRRVRCGRDAGDAARRIVRPKRGPAGSAAGVRQRCSGWRSGPADAIAGDAIFYVSWLSPAGRGPCCAAIEKLTFSILSID